jgi:hypothetical protein
MELMALPAGTYLKILLCCSYLWFPVLLWRNVYCYLCVSFYSFLIFFISLLFFSNSEWDHKSKHRWGVEITTCSF